MSKQYIKTSNQAPSLSLGFFLYTAMAIQFYRLPEWVWGVWGVFLVMIVANFFYRTVNEESVDVVNRRDKESQ